MSGFEKTGTNSFDTPILITGAARSGTSIIASIIHHAGAWGGKLRGKTKYNPLGLYENAELIDDFNKSYLKERGYDPLGQNPVPLPWELDLPEDWKNRIKQVIENQGYNGGTWYFKDAKMALMWPVWVKAFPYAKWIFVKRNINDVVSSCMNTPFMKGYKTREGWEGWAQMYEHRCRELSEKADVVEIETDGIVAGYFTKLKQVIKDLDLKWIEPATLIDLKYWGTFKKLRSDTSQPVQKSGRGEGS